MRLLDVELFEAAFSDKHVKTLLDLIKEAVATISGPVLASDVEKFFAAQIDELSLHTTHRASSPKIV